MLRRLNHGFIALEIFAATVLLGFAWLSPIMSVKTWVFFYKEVTIFQATTKLYEDGFLFLAGIVAVFAIAFPVLKLMVLWAGWMKSRAIEGPGSLEGTLSIFDHLGKWSMLDVFVVAVVIVSTQSSLVADAEAHPGLYLFAASILMSMLAMFHLRAFRRGGRPAVSEAALA